MPLLRQIVFFASLWLRHFLKNTETELVLRWGGLPPIYQDKQQQCWNKNILQGNTLQHKQDQIGLGLLILDSDSGSQGVKRKAYRSLGRSKMFHRINGDNWWVLCKLWGSKGDVKGLLDWSQGGCLGVQKGSRGGLGVLWGQEGCLGDPMGPSGWFDESSDDS